MHLYRQRPHEAYLWPTPSFSSGQHLRFAWCSKVRGFINTMSGRGICKACYDNLVNTANHKPFYAHYLSDRHKFVKVICINCQLPMVTEYPISTYPVCTRTHLNLITALEGDDDINDLDDPTIIYIEGQDFQIQTFNPNRNV